MIAASHCSKVLPQKRIGTYAALIAVLSLALILRLGMTFEFPNINHPDEIYQAIEQARRLTTGAGIVPWEFERGIRSWILPGLYAGLMYFSGRTPDDYLVAIYTVMDLVSLIPVACSFLWGLIVFGPGGAILVGFVTATWAELIYFAPHTLTEVAAGNILPLALYLVYPDRGNVASKRLFAAGILFGLTFILRFHLAPAIGIAVASICRLRVRRRWIPMLVGASIPVLASGALDTLTWQYPFQSIWLNIWVNLYEGVSNWHGITPWYYTIGFLGYFWGGAFAFIVFLALLGARRLPLLLVLALTTLMVHSLIGHKHYRFIYPALPLIATLAGVGTVEVFHSLWGWLGLGFRRAYGVLTAMGLWSCVSMTLLTSEPFQFLMLHSSGVIAAFRSVSRDTGVCGIGLYGVDVWNTPGYSYLRPGIELYELHSTRELFNLEEKFNVIIGNKSVAVLEGSFSQRACFDNGYEITTNQLGTTRIFHGVQEAEPVCIWQRQGNCAR